VTQTPSPPVNTGLPVVSGSAQVGSVLSASTGTWSGSPAPSFAYQWQRCDQSGNGCSPIGSATSSSYTVVQADVGSTLRVTVTATNGSGSASANSSQTAVVAAQGSGVFGTPLLDDFNRAGPDPGANWVALFSGEPKFTISGQQAAGPASAYGGAAWNAATFGPDAEVYATMNSDVGLNLFARVTNPGTTSISGYSVEFHPNLNAVYVYRINKGAYSGVLGGTISATIPRGARVGMRVIGNTISAWVDTGSGWTQLGSRTDTTFTQAGLIGAELYGGTNRTFDNLGGGTTG
jgi:hypothetical protein